MRKVSGFKKAAAAAAGSPSRPAFIKSTPTAVSAAANIAVTPEGTGEKEKQHAQNEHDLNADDVKEPQTSVLPLSQKDTENEMENAGKEHDLKADDVREKAKRQHADALSVSNGNELGSSKISSLHADRLIESPVQGIVGDDSNGSVESAKSSFVADVSLVEDKPENIALSDKEMVLNTLKAAYIEIIESSLQKHAKRINDLVMRIILEDMEKHYYISATSTSGAVSAQRLTFLLGLVAMVTVSLTILFLQFEGSDVVLLPT